MNEHPQPLDLVSMWIRQARQQCNWYDVNALPSEERAHILDKLVLDLHRQVGDLQRRIDLDRYHILRRSTATPNPEDVAEAGVDIFKLLVSILQLHGVHASMFNAAFNSKSDVVDDKWKREQSGLSAGEEALMVDLDGCVADWVTGFLAFCSEHGHIINLSDVNAPTTEPLKDEFHRTGGFLHLQPIDGAKQCLCELRQLGIKTVIVTARPYHQFKRIYADTMAWCEQHGIVFDNIIFKRDKAEAAAQLAPAKVIGFVEDRAKHALEVALTGITVYKLPSYGGESVMHPNIVDVHDWAQIKQLILAARIKESK